MVLSRLSGKKVKYTPIDASSFKEKMKPSGPSESMLNKIIGFNTDIKNGQESEVTVDLENKLGRKPATLSEGLKILFSFQS